LTGRDASFDAAVAIAVMVSAPLSLAPKLARGGAEMATTILQAVPAAADAAEILQKNWLLAAVFAYTLAVPRGALAVWSSDRETDDKPGVLNTDFLAIIDADPKSKSYGKVVNSASLQSVPGANLLNDLTLKDLGSPGDVRLTDALGLTAKYGLPVTGIPSDALNEAHHMTHDPIVMGKHSYLYMGGLISANIFRCDVADPLGATR
jgi:hypothetical protein